jgi:hypothetical protein
MAVAAFVVPILPGKDGGLAELLSALKRQSSEHQESRARAGIMVERLYLQTNPDGNCLLITYLETSGSFAESMGRVAASDLPIDMLLVERIRELSGLDLRAGPIGQPELCAQWLAPGRLASSRRARGRAVVVPLRPGKYDQAKQYAQEAYVERLVEMTESRLAKRLVREEVFLQRTPVRDLLIIYLEGADPVQANRDFAASTTPFDRWCKDSIKTVFPPHVDFNQPAPANEELFAWERPLGG